MLSKEEVDRKLITTARLTHNKRNALLLFWLIDHEFATLRHGYDRG